MFDLEIALATWRRSLLHRRVFSAEDLDELEEHLRDHVAAQVADGADPEAAFRASVRRLGDRFEVEAEYGKVYWRKARHRRRVLENCRGSLVMLKNYMKVALRSLWRHRGYTAINVSGLAIGLACCILLFNLVLSEASYDAFHERGARIHRVLLSLQGNLEYGTPPPLGPSIAGQIPEVERSVRFESWNTHIRGEGDWFAEEVLLADDGFFDVFTFPFERGDPGRALAAPDRIVLGSAAAEKYFGGADPLGRTLIVKLGEAEYPFEVAGVLAEIPENSSLQFNFVLPFERAADVMGPGFLDDWEGFDPNTFVLIREGSSAPAVEAKFAAYVEENMKGLLSAAGLTTADFRILLQPYTDYHLGDVRGGNGLSARGSFTTLAVLFGIAMAILLIACFNFMNLSLGRASARFKEVGVRQVVGARKGQLVRQFLLEALLLTGVALLVGMVLAAWLQPVFDALVGRSVAIDYGKNPALLGALVVLLAVVSLVAGGYPALMLARFKPVEIFKGRLRLGGANAFSRSLVTVQFVLSTVLVVCTVLMARQLRYLAEKPLGFDREAVVVIPTGAGFTNPEQGERVVQVFEQALAGNPDVVGMTGTFVSQGRGVASTDVQRGDESVEVYHYRVDYDYLETLGIELADGRNFAEDRPGDAEGAVIVNEQFAREFGLDTPVGTVFAGFESAYVPHDPTIVGVVRDYHLLSLRRAIGPVVLHLNPKMPMRYVMVKVRPGRVQEALALLEETWQTASPGQPYQYSFLDDDLGRQYQQERRWERLITYAALLAIFVACLGLFGLTAFTTERRTKEIGVRKALGASVADIIVLLSREYALLIACAFVLAVPVGYVVMARWLEIFAYQVRLGFGLFLLAGGLTFAVAALTVGYQAVRAALSNPVDALRYE